jgi:transposase
MLEALIRGERDAEALADMAHGRMRPKIPDLVQAMIGRFGPHHAFLCRMHLDRIDQLTRDVAALSARIEAVMAPFPATDRTHNGARACPDRGALAPDLVVDAGASSTAVRPRGRSPRSMA